MPNSREKIGKNRWTVNKPSQSLEEPARPVIMSAPVLAIGGMFTTRMPHSASPRTTSRALMRSRALKVGCAVGSAS